MDSINSLTNRIKQLKSGILKKGKQAFKMLSQHVIFPFFYSLNSRKPLKKNQVIFADAHKTECPIQMQQLKMALEKQNFEIVEFYFDLARLGTLAGMKKMITFMKLYAQAGFVVLQDNFLPVASCKKRKDTKVIQLWHGCGAFKKFGYDTEDDIPKGYKGNVYRNYNLVPVSSEACIEHFRSAMNIQKKNIVRALGVCDTDRYYDQRYIEEIKEKFHTLYPEAEGKMVLLWAPTFRGMASEAGAGILPGEAEIDNLTKDTRYFVIKSLHPHMLHNRGLKQPAMTTSELMLCADVMITDYSSIFFEFLLIDKPLIFFAPDQEKYEEKRGYYLDYKKLPGHMVLRENWLETVVAHVYKELQENEDSYRTERHKFRQCYMERCDGKATERIVKYLNRYREI